MSSQTDNHSHTDVNESLKDTPLGTSNTTPDSQLSDEKFGDSLSAKELLHSAVKDETNKESSTSVNAPRYYFNKSNMIIQYRRQLFCLLIVVLTAYATYQNIPPNHSKPPDAWPFFPSDSFVKDYPSGELSTVQTKVALSHLSFVMFYAPWSAESQHARTPYEFVAKLFYKEASFSAVNCWQPGGECKKQYAKVMSWPVLMAYNQNSIAIPYNGQWTEAALTRFVLSLIRPLHRIYHPDELLSLIHNHDAVVATFVNMEASNAFYNIYLHTAIKWLERDPYRDVAFAVVTGESIKRFGIDREPSLRLYLWNDTLEYEDNVWKPSLLYKWIGANLRQVTHWLSPPGTKSNEFKPFLKKGPVLVLFTPRNLYESSNDAYAMLRQIGYEYQNCDRNEWLREMAQNYIYEQRNENANEFQRRTLECDQFNDWKRSAVHKCNFSKRTFINLVNSSKFHYDLNALVQQQNEHCSKYSSQNSEQFCDNLESIPSNHKLESQQTESSSAQFTTPETSMLNSTHDPRSPENLAKAYKTINCKINNMSKAIRSRLFYENLSEESINASRTEFNKISALSCNSNHTLALLAMDSFTYELIAERLGITLKDIEQNTAVAIIDSENESTFVLKESLTTSSLIRFIHDFTMNKLNRHLRNSANISYSHYFNDENHYSAEYFHSNQDDVGSRFESKEIRTISLQEMHSVNFKEYILGSNRTVAVLFYSTQCAFCTIFSNTLLTVSRILSEVNCLEFARIDSDKNDLPWEFTMDTLPSLIIFSGEKKSESRKFPASLQVTVPNVLGFILSNLNRPNRLNAMLYILKYNSKKWNAIETSLDVLRREIVDNITYNLKLWRKLPHRRYNLLRRIQKLQNFYLALYRIKSDSDFSDLKRLMGSVLKVWTNDES